MRFLSTCSGIEAASVAWEPLGWEAAAYAEIDPHACAVLEHRYPETPNYGDLTTYEQWPGTDVDVLVGGTPCQSFSVAGLRRGLTDPRGNLMLTFLAIARRYRPEWVVWENVPGVLSSNRGRDFGTLLRGLGECGYGFAYRVLDAQYFGVPQRRRRVFVIGYLGDWRPAAAVLFEPESLRGDSAPRREAGQATAVSPTLRAGGNRTGGDRPPGTDVDTVETLQPVRRPSHWDGGPHPTLSQSFNSGSIGYSNQELFNARGSGLVSEALSFKASHYTRGKDGAPSPVWPPLSADADKGDQDPLLFRMQAFGQYEKDGLASSIKARDYKDHTDLIAFPTELSSTQVATSKNVSPALSVKHTTSIAFNSDQSEKTRSMGEREEQSPTLRAGGAISVALPIQNALRGKDQNGLRIGSPMQPMFTLDQGSQHAIAFQERGREGGRNVEAQDDLAYSLNSPSGGGRRQELNIAVEKKPPLPLAFAQNTRDEVRLIGGDVGNAGALAAQPGAKQQTYLAFQPRFARNDRGAPSEIAAPLTAEAGRTGDSAQAVANGFQVRRLTPIECERLQGFPDNWTLVPYRGKAMADRPRYKMLGNSMAVPVMQWIGEGIQAISEIIAEKKEGRS